MDITKQPAIIIDLTDAASAPLNLVGGKGRSLGRLIKQGFSVPRGFCLSTAGYLNFVERNGLINRIKLELGRKSITTMRWEEVWDCALRIRSAFLQMPVPRAIMDPVCEAYHALNTEKVIVRSSAVAEDSAAHSYAGLHDSIANIDSVQDLEKAICKVWSSLWSDSALMYRKELGLDPIESSMAIVVQEIVERELSGVAFSQHPLKQSSDSILIEVTSGNCENLVSGKKEPDRWELAKSSGEQIKWQPSHSENKIQKPLLSAENLKYLSRVVIDIERKFECPVDVEWTGTNEDIWILQARPISNSQQHSHDKHPTESPADKRPWYLSLKRSQQQMRSLTQRVVENLIPQLQQDIKQLSSQSLKDLNHNQSADTIRARQEKLLYWQKIYHDEFIPFAHGVRQFGMYYNDVQQPDNPFEFVDLLVKQPLIAMSRNRELLNLAQLVKKNSKLGRSLTEKIGCEEANLTSYSMIQQELINTNDPAITSFMNKIESYINNNMQMLYQGQSLLQNPLSILRIILELANDTPVETDTDLVSNRRKALEKDFLAKIKPNEQKEATELLAIARLSWQLRDDDNILMGQLEYEVLRAIIHGCGLLSQQKKIAKNFPIQLSHADKVIKALEDPDLRELVLKEPKEQKPKDNSLFHVHNSRQICGQPASVGFASGKARVVRKIKDLNNFRKNEILVCDVIEPTMTHIIPLAAGIVERRGGMLIHSAIIAREIGIPCVNGIFEAMEQIETGTVVAVDGYLGVVTIGEPEFDMELDLG